MPATPQKLQDFAAHVQKLYTLPRVALDVMEITSQQSVDVRALKQCVERDPALVSKILRVVNSSFFGMSQQVSDLNQALALLGVKPLKMLVLGFSLAHGSFSRMTGAAAERFWRYALVQAVAARELAEHKLRSCSEEAFIAGLLGDIGMLVLLQELGETYADVIHRAVAARKDVTVLETAALGYTHHQLTAVMLEGWKLPPTTVRSVTLARQPEADSSLSETDRKLVDILKLARLLADLLVDGQYESLREVIRFGSERFGLGQGALAELAGAINTKITPMAEVFSVELPNDLDYRDVLMCAHGQLADAVDDGISLLRKGNSTSPTAVEESLQRQVQSLADAAANVVGPREGNVSTQSTRAAAASTSDTSNVRSGLRSTVIQPELATQTDLTRRLQFHVANCRQSRQPISLLLAELDGLDAIIASLGPVAANQLVHELHRICHRYESDGGEVLQIAEARFAVLLPGCDRVEGARFGNALIDAARELDSAVSSTLSVGLASVALPPKNFRSENLLVSAERCLVGAQLSGGGVLKSLEIYS
jgi:HD-like signal output (HDOD) protein/GGDEF domain-containing protein